MSDEPQKSTAGDTRREFWEAISQADRVQVHKLNALGEYDTHNFGPEAIAAIAAMQPTPQEGVANCPGYSPDIQAMGDCRHCGHTAQSHTTLRAIAGEARHD